MSIAIFALITKKLYVNTTAYKRLSYYSVIGAFFGMWAFFSYENIPFLSLGLFRTFGLYIAMFIYAAVIISPFVFVAHRTKKKKMKTIQDIPSSLASINNLDKDINNEMVYCQNCGKKIKNTDKFCQYCGKKTGN